MDTRIHLVSFLSAKWPESSDPGWKFSKRFDSALFVQVSFLFFLLSEESRMQRRGRTKGKRFHSRRRRGGERAEINADCYSRNLMRSHLPGTWPALVCASLVVSSYSLCRNGRGCFDRSLRWFTKPFRLEKSPLILSAANPVHPNSDSFLRRVSRQGF